MRRTKDYEGYGKRFDWEPRSIFITPPGLWHSHHNESGQPVHILPIQEAGLHTYLRTLSVLFSHRTATVHDGGVETWFAEMVWKPE